MVFKVLVMGSNDGSNFINQYNNQLIDVISNQANPRIVILKVSGADINMQINTLFFDNESLVAEGVIVNNSTRQGGNASLRLVAQKDTSEIIDATEVIVVA